MSDEPVVDPNAIWVFDFETDNLNDSNRAFSASPFYEENEIVAGCWAEIKIDPGTGDEKCHVGSFHRCIIDDTMSEDITKASYLPWLLCGHNARYDLQFLRKPNGSTYPDAVARGDVTLWDTQFAEYLLTGQAEKMSSLNKLAEKYGLGAKHDEVKEMWDAGYKTHEIDPDVLREYVEQDVRLTKDIALRQIAKAYELDMLDFILVQMRSLFVVSEYEYNGMYVDTDRLGAIRTRAKFNAIECMGLALDKAMDYFRDAGVISEVQTERGADVYEAESLLTEWFDIDSVDKLKRIIFGGMLEFDVHVPNGEYKTGKKKGQTKYKKERFSTELPEVVPPRLIPDENLTPKGKEARKAGKRITYKEVSLDDAAIKKLEKMILLPGSLCNLLSAVLGYRDNKKLETTYCQQVTDYLFENNNCIHCNLNVDNTPTGRLTSSNPNMQNMPSKSDSDFKSVFTSRFENGKIATVDFKQLEVIGLAYLTQDRQLTDDLMTGRDIHYETGKEAGLWRDPSEMDADTRKEIKRLNFGSIYGAGKKKLAAQGSMGEAIVDQCLRALKDRYSTAFGKEYVSGLEETLDYYAERLGRDDTGLMRYGNYLYQPTGRRIWVETVAGKDWNGNVLQQWPYTCLRNYPVQSIAADIVAIARSLFYDVIGEHGSHGNILMVNEVHDEIVFDLDETIHGTTELFKDIVEEVEDRLKERLTKDYGLQREFDLPLVLEVGIGDNWQQAK